MSEVNRVEAIEGGLGSLVRRARWWFWLVEELVNATVGHRRPNFTRDDWAELMALKSVLGRYARRSRLPSAATLPPTARQPAPREASSVTSPTEDWMAVTQKMCDAFGLQPRRVRQLLADHHDEHPEDARIRKVNRSWSVRRDLVDELLAERRTDAA